MLACRITFVNITIDVLATSAPAWALVYHEYAKLNSTYYCRQRPPWEQCSSPQYEPYPVVLEAEDTRSRHRAGELGSNPLECVLFQIVSLMWGGGKDLIIACRRRCMHCAQLARRSKPLCWRGSWCGGPDDDGAPSCTLRRCTTTRMAGRIKQPISARYWGPWCPKPLGLMARCRSSGNVTITLKLRPCSSLEG